MNWFRTGAWVMAIAVLLGAFGAHGLEGRVTEKALGWWQTAVRYQAWHGLGILALACMVDRAHSKRALEWAGWLLLVGVIIFSGSLYGLALNGPRWLGALTPLGRISWVVAWIILGCTTISSSGPRGSSRF